MAFTTTIISTNIIGAKKQVIGYTTTDTTGGDIDTGLQTVEALVPVDLSGANAVQVNETFPMNGKPTIVNTSGHSILFIAVGV